MTPLLAAVVVAHVTMIVCRRLRRGLIFTGVIAVVVMALQLTWTHYRATANRLVPTGRTRDAIDADLTTAWELFGEVQAPTEAVTGFVVAGHRSPSGSSLTWPTGRRFRLWSPLEAVLPSFAIFVFIAFFGDRRRPSSCWRASYLAAVIGFQLFAPT